MAVLEESFLRRVWFLMKSFSVLRPSFAALRQPGLWLVLVAPVGVLAGSASALFLWSLECVTRTRFDQPWLLWLLPVAGVGMAWAYQLAGKNVERGTNLLIDEIH